MSDDHTDLDDTMADPEKGTHRIEFTYESDPPSVVVVEAVAALTGKEVQELDPLYNTIDPDTLDKLFRPTVKGVHQGDGQISFTYHGYDVTVRSYGVIDIAAVESDEGNGA